METILQTTLPIAARVQARRSNSRREEQSPERTVATLTAVGDIWHRRLAADWTPDIAGTSFPWQMTRRSLAALIPGLKSAGDWLAREAPDYPAHDPKTIALILAGNTPLMSWSPIAACLLAGHSVFVKMSSDETLWPRLLRDSIAEIDSAVASRIEIDVWPGEDARTNELIESTDAIVAFGSDSTISALRVLASQGTPFFGFGHAVSIGIVSNGAHARAMGFAVDTLMYTQSGCLSPQAIFVEGPPSRAMAVAGALASSMSVLVRTLDLRPVDDPATARAIRNARDLALFSGAKVTGDDCLRWTVVTHREPVKLDSFTANCVLHVVPTQDLGTCLKSQLGILGIYLTSVGVAGNISTGLRQTLESLKISRMCAAGDMQLPPLDWPNGNVELIKALSCL